MSIKVKPELPSGFRDYSPEEMLLKNWLIEQITRIFALFGFDPLDTSTIHQVSVLFGNEASASNAMEHFRVHKSKGEVDSGLAMRFDLTVSLARYIAANLQDIPKPFKRWQVGKVYRGEKSQAGRFNEFIQCDADIMFVDDVKADAEIVALMYYVLQAIQAPDFIIRINNRKILDGLPQLIGFDQKFLWQVLRIIDKADKIGIDEVGNQLQGNMPEDERTINEEVVELTKEQVGKLFRFLLTNGKTDQIVLEKLAQMMANIPVATEGIQELQDLFRYLDALGVDQTKVKFDLIMVRGLSYYTGPVFEANLIGKATDPETRKEVDLASFGTIYAGGRFDNLVGRFCDATVPGTGASVGIDRLLTAMKLVVPQTKTAVQVMITVMNSDRYAEYLEIAKTLREAGINTMVYAAEDMVLKAQVIRAVKYDIPVIIFADRELDDGVVNLKDVAATVQKQVPLADLVDEVKKVLTR